MSSSLLRTIAAASVLLLIAAASGCGDDKPAQRTAQSASAEPPAAQAPAAADTAPTAAAGGLTVAGVSFTPPANWEDLGPREMRKAQYRLPAVGQDAAPAEVNVFYFGSGQGGDVDANLARWAGQMSDTAGEPQRSSFNVGTMPAHLITVDGSYGGGMSGPMGGGGVVNAGYRLVGVVLEAPEGNVFFKLTGPAATARAMEADLMAMVQGARPAG